MLRATAKFMTSSHHRQALLRHMTQYVDLAAAELELATSQALRRAVYAGIAAVLTVVALTLVGVALMLAQTAGVTDWQRAPLLWVVPAVVAAFAIVFGVIATTGTRAPAFEGLRAQLNADAEIMREVFGDAPEIGVNVRNPSDAQGRIESDLERIQRQEREALVALAERTPRSSDRYPGATHTAPLSNSSASVVVN